MFCMKLEKIKTAHLHEKGCNTMNALTEHFEYNVEKIKQRFHYPQNYSLKIRRIVITALDKEVVIFFIESTTDKELIELHIIKPLIDSTIRVPHEENGVTYLIEKVLTASFTKKINTFDDAIYALINGHTVIFVEDESEAVVVDTQKYTSRQITEPLTETVVKGPKESFNESVLDNRSLIRKRIKDPDLMCEIIRVGNREPQEISMLYIKDIANDELVKEVKKRINEINIDTVLDLTVLEHLIESHPYSLIPSTMTTERPDRTCSFLREGHIVLLMDGSPFALVVPVTFWMLFHTSEDQYLRWISGNFIRVIRLLALFITLLVPAGYLAVTSYHPEMLPTDLTLAISAAREQIPMPVFWELLFMEITLEILREAGIRVPSAIGPTIGIVGAIILGQAAVEANVVSPILVIIVSITGLASFTIPDVGFNVAVRIVRFIFLIAANAMGFVGLSLCFIAFLIYATSYTSFGVPFFAPLSPSLPSSKDLYVRPPLQKQWRRPTHLKPKDEQRMNPKGAKK